VSRLTLDPQVSPAPASIGDWEELLIRFELGPRALGLAAADAGDGEGADRIYRHLAEVEAEAAGWLGAPVSDTATDPSAKAARERFERLRATSFARIQRRGPGEAERALSVGGGEEATVHQVLVALVRHDGAHLAELRREEAWK